MKDDSINFWGEMELNTLYQLALNYIKSGDCVLDAGTGTGHGSYHMAVNSECEVVVGLDVSDYALEWARTNFSTSKNIYYNVDLARDFTPKLPQNQFDVATCFNTIEHLVESKPFFEKINALLKSDGIFLISSPNEDITTCTENLFYKGRKNSYQHRHYTPEKLKQILRKCGFFIVDAFTICPNKMVRGEHGSVITYVCKNIDKKYCLWTPSKWNIGA